MLPAGRTVLGRAIARRAVLHRAARCRRAPLLLAAPGRALRSVGPAPPWLGSRTLRRVRRLAVGRLRPRSTALDHLHQPADPADVPRAQGGYPLLLHGMAPRVEATYGAAVDVLLRAALHALRDGPVEDEIALHPPVREIRDLLAGRPACSDKSPRDGEDPVALTEFVMKHFQILRSQYIYVLDVGELIPHLQQPLDTLNR
mmetsp:Transcript_102739/g.268153  ORF Transcript_102739/g.268153 Transcript_102739/m.268153 type:complete len:201 (-) Transcript_102739:455-1057(-)